MIQTQKQSQKRLITSTSKNKKTSWWKIMVESSED
jgi:hypothetical protein